MSTLQTTNRNTIDADFDTGSTYVAPVRPSSVPVAPKASKPAIKRETVDEKAARLWANGTAFNFGYLSDLEYTVPSDSNPGDIHTLTVGVSGSVTCDCKAGERGVRCWRVAAWEIANAPEPVADPAQYEKFALTEVISDVDTTVAETLKQVDKAAMRIPVLGDPHPDSEAINAMISLSDSSDKPHEDWVRGSCPECGFPLVSNMSYVAGQGYLVVWECWASMAETPTCTYRRVLQGLRR